MKKFLAVILYLTLLTFPPQNQNLNAVKAVELSYAQIGENAILYTLSGDDYIPITSLPDTYFVIVLSTDSQFVKVSYLDIEGYVNASEITPVDFIPKYKYASANLIVSNDGHPVNFRQSPSIENNILCTVPSGSEIFYYGSVFGDVQNVNIGNLWYYARISTPDGKTVRGYIYSLYAQADEITPNIIEPEIIPPKEQPKDQLTATIFSTTQTREIVIIVSLCLPVFGLTYLIFRREKRL